jgi:hypothetical protein
MNNNMDMDNNNGYGNREYDSKKGGKDGVRMNNEMDNNEYGMNKKGNKNYEGDKSNSYGKDGKRSDLDNKNLEYSSQGLDNKNKGDKITRM